MIEQSQSHFKCMKAFAIGGQPKDRAALFRLLADHQIAIEPLDSMEELTTADLARADAFFVCGGTEAFRGLRRRLAEEQNFAPIIAFDSQPAVETVVRALDAGASSFVEAPFSLDKVLEAIDAASRKSHCLGTHTRRALAAKFKLKCLSVRERDVLESVADGLSNKLIATRLAISPRTVEIHRANAFGKLGVTHSAEAIRLVLESNFYDSLLEETAGLRQGFG